MLQAIILSLLLAFSQWGCAFVAGAGAGAAATGAGYEIQAKRQLDKLEADFRAGKISREDYLARKKQIEDGSLIY